MSSPSAPNAASTLPHIHLLCMEPRFATAFRAASTEYRLPSSVSVTIHQCSLAQLPASVKFDTIVSPANSYGRLDGAFDDAISRAFSPSDDYLALTHVAQRTLYQHWRGFAPPGTCTLVRIPDAFRPRSRNVWDTSRVALCPTMRVPTDVRWDREVVYECLWSLLCAVDNHNRGVADADAGEQPIRSLLMTPLATGVGNVSPQRWAAQAVLAVKHFVDALEHPARWSRLEWADLETTAGEVGTTWDTRR